MPFALAAGLSGAVDSSTVVIMAGLAEVAAGSIAMGLRRISCKNTDAEHYTSERATEVQETIDIPEKEAEEVALYFAVTACPKKL